MQFTKVHRPFKLGKCWNITPIEGEELSGECLPLPLMETVEYQDVVAFLEKIGLQIVTT